MSSRRKNRSTPAARAARQRAARTAARDRRPEPVQRPKERTAHPLMALHLPYSGYAAWITPQTVVDTEGAGEEMLALHAKLQRLAPLYAGSVPTAALTLQSYIEQGRLPVATPGAVDGVSLLPVPDLATVLAETAGPDDLDAGGDADTGQLLHELHFLGALFLDDDHIVRLAELV